MVTNSHVTKKLTKNKISHSNFVPPSRGEAGASFFFFFLPFSHLMGNCNLFGDNTAKLCFRIAEDLDCRTVQLLQLWTSHVFFSSVLSFWMHQCHCIPGFYDGMFYQLNGIDCSAGPLNLQPKGNSLLPAAILFCKVRICPYKNKEVVSYLSEQKRQLADLC